MQVSAALHGRLGLHTIASTAILLIGLERIFVLYTCALRPEFIIELSSVVRISYRVHGATVVYSM